MISRRLFLGGLAAAPAFAVPLLRAFIRDDGAQPRPSQDEIDEANYNNSLNFIELKR